MIRTPQELQAALGQPSADEGMAPRSTNPARPWYISALLGISGWVAGLFLLVFVALLLRPSSTPAALGTGAVLVCAAWALYKLDREGASAAHAFVAQLALAFSIAGQCFLLYALGDLGSSASSGSLAGLARNAFVLQLVLALVMPNALHRSLSTLFASIAWALAWHFGLAGEPAFWHGTQASRDALSLPSTLAAWGLAWLPVALGLWVLIRREAEWMARGWQPVLRPMATGLILGLGFATLASHPFESFIWFGGNASSLGWLALWPLLSAIGALGAMAAAFALRSRALMAACVVAVLGHVAQFYYTLGTSLLFKSVLMLALGAALLLASRLLRTPHSPTKGV